LGKTFFRKGAWYQIENALGNGFYVIEPSGEDVKVIKPGSHPRVW
jgi:hypothetical protein